MNLQTCLEWRGRPVWVKMTANAAQVTRGEIISARYSALAWGEIDLIIRLEHGGVTYVYVSDKGTRWDFDEKGEAV
jgi:Holliday junction resolvase-like predicted endonuclease